MKVALFSNTDASDVFNSINKLAGIPQVTFKDIKFSTAVLQGDMYDSVGTGQSVVYSALVIYEVKADGRIEIDCEKCGRKFWVTAKQENDTEYCPFCGDGDLSVEEPE